MMSDPMRHHASSSSFVLSIENQKYQIQQKKRTKTPQGSPSKRPPRACRAKTPSRLAPLAPSVQRSTPRTQNRATRHGIRSCDKNINGNAGNGNGHVGISAGKEGIVIRSGGGSIPMVLVPTPASLDQNPVCFLRRMWELASILHFMNVFRPILKFNSDFTIKDLENALLMPNSLLDEIHIALLKAIRPISRTPINQDTWVALLCKKMIEWWPWVAEGSFPLAPYHGVELETYKELTPDTRVIILKALCEARADQEDARAFIDDMLKKGVPLSHIRKERTGIDMHGSRYWYENDPITGQRLYRELRNTDHKDKPNLRGRFMPPPSTCNWETLATEYDEFQSVADKLSLSWNRMEVTIGKRINNTIIPDLKDLQKRKERALKKQQRQAVLLDSSLNTEDMSNGRSKRERKPVTYTFDDYDKSISDAIKITKRWHSSPEMVIGRKKSSNGSTKQTYDEKVNLHQPEDQHMAKKTKPSRTKTQLKPTKLTTPHPSESDSSLSGGLYVRERQHSKLQRYADDDFVNTVSGGESGYSSEDDIEGEAIYAANYDRRKRKKAESSDDNDEYRGREEEEDGHNDDENEQESTDEGVYGWENNYDDDDEQGHRRRGQNKEMQENVDKGALQRSQWRPSTKIHSRYMKCEESDMEYNEEIEDSDVPDKANSDEQVDNCNEVIVDDRDEKQLEVIVDVHDIKEITINDVHEIKQLNMNEVCEVKHIAIDNILDVKQLECTISCPDDQNNVVSRDGDSKIAWHTDDKKVIKTLSGILEHQTIDELKHGPCVEIRPRRKLHRHLDMNIVGGGQEVNSGGGKPQEKQMPTFSGKKIQNHTDNSPCNLQELQN